MFFFSLLLRDFNAMALFLPALSSLRTPPCSLSNSWPPFPLIVITRIYVYADAYLSLNI